MGGSPVAERHLGCSGDVRHDPMDSIDRGPEMLGSMAPVDGIGDETAWRPSPGRQSRASAARVVSLEEDDSVVCMCASVSLVGIVSQAVRCCGRRDS